MRILGFTPFHPAYGIRPQTLASIQAAIMAYDGPIEWVFSHNDNPFDLSNDNIAYQHNKAAKMVNDGNYDALLSVEADMIIPPDAVSGLIDCEADIAYGLYVWRHNLKRWNAYEDVGLFGGHSFSLKHSTARAAWGTIQDVRGMGMGCTLIKRHVFDVLEFRLFDGRNDWLFERITEEVGKVGMTISPGKDMRGMVHDDWLLALEAAHFGLSQRCNFSVVCGHIESDGRILWPSAAAPDLFYVETVNGLSDS